MSPKIPKVQKKTKDGSNVDPTKDPEPKVNPERWKYVGSNFVQPSWGFIKEVKTMSLVSVFEMFYGMGRIASEHLTSLAMDDNPQRPDFDIFTLFAGKIKEGYFGDFVGRYGEFGRGGFSDLGWLNSLTSFPLPTDKVFSFIQEKNITGLIESYGYETQPGLQELIEYFSAKEKSKTKPTSNKTQKEKLSPAPSTDKAKKEHLHKAYVSAVEKKIKAKKELRNQDLLKDSDLKLLIKESGTTTTESNLLGKWIPEARKNVGISAPKGRPPKK